MGFNRSDLLAVPLPEELSNSCDSSAIAFALRALGERAINTGDVDRVAGRARSGLTSIAGQIATDKWLLEKGYRLEVVAPKLFDNAALFGEHATYDQYVTTLARHQGRTERTVRRELTEQIFEDARRAFVQAKPVFDRHTRRGSLKEKAAPITVALIQKRLEEGGVVLAADNGGAHTFVMVGFFPEPPERWGEHTLTYSHGTKARTMLPLPLFNLDHQSNLHKPSGITVLSK